MDVLLILSCCSKLSLHQACRSAIGKDPAVIQVD
jgi:hypothetical protein